MFTDDGVRVCLGLWRRSNFQLVRGPQNWILRHFQAEDPNFCWKLCRLWSCPFVHTHGSEIAKPWDSYLKLWTGITILGTENLAMYTRNLMYFPANSVPILAVTLTALVVVPNLAPESIVLQLKGHWKDTVVILVLFPDQLFLPRRGKNSLVNSLFCFISCGCKNCDIKFVGMYYDIMQSVELLWDTVMPFYLSFSEVLITKERSWKEKPLSASGRLWSKLITIQTFHCRFQALKHIPTVHKTSDSLLVI